MEYFRGMSGNELSKVLVAKTKEVEKFILPEKAKTEPFTFNGRVYEVSTYEEQLLSWDDLWHEGPFTAFEAAAIPVVNPVLFFPRSANKNKPATGDTSLETFRKAMRQCLENDVPEDDVREIFESVMRQHTAETVMST